MTGGWPAPASYGSLTVGRSPLLGGVEWRFYLNNAITFILWFLISQVFNNVGHRMVISRFVQSGNHLKYTFNIYVNLKCTNARLSYC